MHPPPKSRRQVFGANIQILRKKKFLKKSFLQVCCDYHSVFGLSFDSYIRACVRVREQKMVETDNFRVDTTV